MNIKVTAFTESEKLYYTYYLKGGRKAVRNAEYYVPSLFFEKAREKKKTPIARADPEGDRGSDPPPA